MGNLHPHNGGRDLLKETQSQDQEQIGDERQIWCASMEVFIIGCDMFYSVKPIVSVVICTYNRLEMLRGAIASVINQNTSVEFEIVVVNDASTDETQSYLDSLADARIKPIHRRQNGGNASARNEGILASQGLFLSFLDDDDEFEVDYFNRMLEGFSQAKDADFGWCGVTRVGETENEVLSWVPSFSDKESAFLGFLQSRRVGTDYGLMLRRQVLAESGIFDARLRKAVDTDFLIRLVRVAHFFALDKPLVRVRDHSGPRVRNNPILGAEAYRLIIDKHLQILRHHPRIYSALLYKVGWQYLHGGDRIRCLRALSVAIMTHFSGKTLALLIMASLLPCKDAVALHKWLAKTRKAGTF